MKFRSVVLLACLSAVAHGDPPPPPTLPPSCLIPSIRPVLVPGEPINVKKNCGVTAASPPEVLRQILAYAIHNCVPVYLPAGRYQVSGNMASLVIDGTHRGSGLCLKGPQLVMKGDGPGLTQLVAQPGSEGVLFSVRGQGGYLHNWLSVEDLTIDGAGQSVGGFYLEAVTLARFGRVQFVHLGGSAVKGRKFWDSVFDNVHFFHTGSVNVPAVDLGPLDATNRFTNSNNISFTNCHWESSPYVSLLLWGETRKVRVVGSKFHGTLPPAETPGGTPDSENNPSVPYPHVQILNSDSNLIEGTNFARSGAATIVISNASGNVVTGNVVGDHLGPFVRLLNAQGNVVTNNAETPGDHAPNNSAVHVEGAAGNVVSGNAFP